MTSNNCNPTLAPLPWAIIGTAWLVVIGWPVVPHAGAQQTALQPNPVAESSNPDLLLVPQSDTLLMALAAPVLRRISPADQSADPLLFAIQTPLSTETQWLLERSAARHPLILASQSIVPATSLAQQDATVKSWSESSVTLGQLSCRQLVLGEQPLTGQRCVGSAILG